MDEVWKIYGAEARRYGRRDVGAGRSRNDRGVGAGDAAVSTVEQRQRVRRIVKSLQHYMNTYDQQAEYEHYSDVTIINDVLYGLGIALEPEKYYAASGFAWFKERLKELL